MKKNKFISIILIIAIAAFILSGAIALPIIFRPFYYLHIGMLDLVEKTGFDYNTIKTAYDQMMDFCLGISPVFATGDLLFSNEAMLHFVDCRNLFMIDFLICGFSASIIVFYLILNKLKKIEAYHFKNHNCGYYAAISLLSSFTIITLIASSNFDKAFTTFHQLFFPGKNNWIFDPVTDQIIEILPETFFMNCGIIIVTTLFILCLILIIKDKKEQLSIK